MRREQLRAGAPEAPCGYRLAWNLLPLTSLGRREERLDDAQRQQRILDRPARHQLTTQIAGESVDLQRVLIHRFEIVSARRDSAVARVVADEHVAGGGPPVRIGEIAARAAHGAHDPEL